MRRHCLRQLFSTTKLPETYVSLSRQTDSSCNATETGKPRHFSWSYWIFVQYIWLYEPFDTFGYVKSTFQANVTQRRPLYFYTTIT